MKNLNITYEESKKITEYLSSGTSTGKRHFIITGTNQLKGCMSPSSFKDYRLALEKYSNTFVLPIQLPNCHMLTIRKSFLNNDDIFQLSSTYGLPEKVFSSVCICDQYHLELDNLNYENMKNVTLENSTFKSFLFLKKWKPITLTLSNTNFKTFDAINENVTNLDLREMCSDNITFTDFSKITLLKDLEILTIHKNSKLSNTTESKSKYVNLIEVLNLHDVLIKTYNHLSDDICFDIVKKYFNKPDRKQYVMDCLLELLDNDYINASW